MRAVIQRVERAKVSVDGKVVGSIGKGILVLVGFLATDDAKTMDYMLDKLVNLRIFTDTEDKMNLSLKDVSGELLLVPNFTLYGDARHGRRPSYSGGAAPAAAAPMFEALVEKAKATGVPVAAGIFQADMQVSLVNDGPVTLLLDSEKNF